MGRPASKWDNRTFTNRLDVAYGTAPLAVWDPTYLHLALVIYVPSAAAIDTSLAGDPNITLLGPYDAGDAGGEIICCRKTVYVSAPYVVLLLRNDLSLVEAWNRLRGAIIDAAAEAACRPMIDWLHAAIVRSGPNAHSALVVPNPSEPLPDALLLQHRHRLLLIHLPGLDPSINRVVGTHISETVGDVVVELREMRLENKRVQYKKENKGAAEYSGANLAHLLNLVQVTDSKYLPPNLVGPRAGPKAPATLSAAEGLRHGRIGHGVARPDHHNTLHAETGTRAWVQDGKSGRPHHRTSPLRPWPAHGHSKEVPARPGIPILHGGLRRGRNVLGGR